MTVTTQSRVDVTTITALVSDVPNLASRTYRADSGAPFIPERVTLVLSRWNPEDKRVPAVKVTVSGANILKSGKPGQQRLECEYSSRGGHDYVVGGLPLDEMPQWLAQWVQDAPDEVLS